MIVTTEYADIPLAGSPMRTLIAAPKAEGRYPGIWCYSDIFQLTPPLVRTCVRLAGYGFVVAAPEIYRRIEPPGTVIAFDDAGKVRGQQDAVKTPVAHFDADCRLGLDWFAKHPKVATKKIGAVGPGTFYYDPASFASVGIVNTFGSMGRNVIRNPGVWNTDMTISRIFPIKERLKLQFRGEFYNLPNTSHFNGPASANVTGGANFMSIRSSFGERQIRFGARFQW